MVEISASHVAILVGICTAVGAIMGAGITYGVMKQTVFQHSKELERLSTEIHTMSKKCERYRTGCQSSLCAKIEEIGNDLYFIRGALSSPSFVAKRLANKASKMEFDVPGSAEDNGD